MASQPLTDIADDTMDDSELVSILKAHEVQAIGYQGADNDITSDQEQALNYYNGVMDDVPAQEGTSSVKDGTVALVVDNAVAATLKPFVSSDETVSFVPRRADAVKIAEQATEYINYIINCDNPGFLILHNWFKDAFLAKVGVIKVSWEDTSYTDAQQVPIGDDIHGAFLRSQPNYLGEQNGVATMGEQVSDGRVRIENIPPEEFRISPASRSDEVTPYIAHCPLNKTRSDLLEMGFDPEIVEGLPAYSSSTTDSTLGMARYADENFIGSAYSSPDKALDIIAIRDEFARIDYDGDGIAELRRVVRVDDTVLYNEPVDDHEFASLCPIPMPHKFYGHALADRVVQEQKIGTVLWRQSLDNLYKSNNPRPVVGDAALLTDGSTADSLNDSAPGAAIMVRDATQFRFDAVPFVADKSFGMMELLDKKVEENSGVSRAGQGLDTNALRKSGQMTATEMAMIANGKNARTEMVARIFAETGVSRMFKLILKLVVKHQPRERIIRLRKQFVPMDPRGWPEMDVAIAVGLGVGDKGEQVAQADSVLQTMAELVQSPFADLVSEENAYNAVKRKYTASGIKNVDDYLTEPQKGPDGKPLPKEPQKSPEQMKAEGELALQAQKQQADQAAMQAKFALQLEQQQHDQQLARDQAEFEANLAMWKADQEAALAERKMQMEASLAAQKNQLAHEAKLEQLDSDDSLPTNRPGGDLAE